jgi:hypothetical protein
MQKILVLMGLTLMACGDSTRPATDQEVQEATSFLGSASSIKTSFAGQTFVGAGTSTTGCATLSGDQLTFDCQGVTGSITKSGDSYTFDVHVNDTFVVDESGQITVTDDLIDGDVAMNMSSDQFDMSTSLTFDGITLTNGCPTGGHLDASVTASAAGRRESRGISIDFGPACGEATIHE